VDVSVVFANNDRGGTNSMKIWFLILSLVDCIVCPTEKPSIHYSIEDAAMEIGRYKNIKQVDLFEFDPTTTNTDAWKSFGNLLKRALSAAGRPPRLQ
jgi:hypothetical protein